MSVANFSSLSGLEVAEKFVVVVGWGCGVVEHVATMYNSNEVVLELICVGF